jgi:hypothetical protein
MGPRLLQALALAAGCDSLVPPPPSPPDLAHPRAALRPLVADMAAAPDLARPSLVEIEVRGKVEAPGAPAGKAVVVLTDGPCFQPGSHYLGAMPARVGQKYFIEIFPPRGTRIDVCAALVVNGVRTTAWHGRAAKAPLLAEGQGDVAMNDIDVKIAKQKPISLPDDLKIE